MKRFIVFLAAVLLSLLAFYIGSVRGWNACADEYTRQLKNTTIIENPPPGCSLRIEVIRGTPFDDPPAKAEQPEEPAA